MHLSDIFWKGGNCDFLSQGCHNQGKISGKWNFFQVREKSGNLVDGEGNLERTWKVREKSGNLKIIGYGRQSFRKFIYSVQEGKGCSFSWESLSPPPSALGATLKERICSFGEQIFSFKSNLQIWSDTVNTIKVSNKKNFLFFFYLSEGMENCKMSGKNQGKVWEFWSGW